jgi:hypothetical protein
MSSKKTKEQEQEQEKVIFNADELKSFQNELASRNDTNYIKTELPQDAKLKKIELTRNMAICLVFVYKHYRYSENVLETDYFDKKTLLQYLKDFPNITRNFHKLKHWDLIQPMPTSQTEVIYKKGWYGITENAIKFVQQEIGLPKCAFVWNDFAYEHQTNPYYLITDLIEEELLNELLIP